MGGEIREKGGQRSLQRPQMPFPAGQPRVTDFFSCRYRIQKRRSQTLRMSFLPPRQGVASVCGLAVEQAMEAFSLPLYLHNRLAQPTCVSKLLARQVVSVYFRLASLNLRFPKSLMVRGVSPLRYHPSSSTGSPRPSRSPESWARALICGESVASLLLHLLLDDCSAKALRAELWSWPWVMLGPTAS